MTAVAGMREFLCAIGVLIVFLTVSVELRRAAYDETLQGRGLAAV